MWKINGKIYKRCRNGKLNRIHTKWRLNEFESENFGILTTFGKHVLIEPQKEIPKEKEKGQPTLFIFFSFSSSIVWENSQNPAKCFNLI